MQLKVTQGWVNHWPNACNKRCSDVQENQLSMYECVCDHADQTNW